MVSAKATKIKYVFFDRIRLINEIIYNKTLSIKILHNLYNKTRIYIFVAYSWQNGWTEWTDIFCGHSGVAGG